MSKITVLRKNINIDGALCVSEEIVQKMPNEARFKDLNTMLSILKRGTLEITDEEIEKKVISDFNNSGMDEHYCLGFRDCWEYIKSRINQ